METSCGWASPGSTTTPSQTLSGNYLIGGASGRDSANGGTAAIFYRDLNGPWYYQQDLAPSPGTASGHFGDAVDIDGAWAVVGAPLADGAAVAGGAAYLFHRVSGVWTQETVLLPPGAGATQFDYFGGAVAIRDAGFSLWVAIGARGRALTGSVFLYEVVLIPSFAVSSRGELSPVDLVEGALFGGALAISGDRLVVGAPGAETVAASSISRAMARTGAIFAFERDGSSWIEVGRRTASDAAAFDEFGFAVAIDGTRVVVGAPRHGPGSPSNPGAAYVYDWADVLDALFADGFESGDVDRWSSRVPAP